MFRELTRWFAAVRRPFPWRENPTPYRVLVSELMLQQTQAARVVDFFERWMQKFPSVEALALASEAEVIKAWEGLGYYSRARSLHAIAKIVCATYNGTIPSTHEALLRLPGIGPYTAGAILSFAFHKRAVAIDANVSRVLVRYFGETQREKLLALLETVLPDEEPWFFLEALIELGALVCRRIPGCSECPLSSNCRAKGNAELIAPASPSKKVLRLFRDVCLFHYVGSILVVKRSGRAVMSGLYEFPFFDSMPRGRSPQELVEHIERSLSCSSMGVIRMGCVAHTFTRHRATLYPAIVQVSEPFDFEDGAWIKTHMLSDLPFSSGHRKVLVQFLSTIS